MARRIRRWARRDREWPAMSGSRHADDRIGDGSRINRADGNNDHDGAQLNMRFIFAISSLILLRILCYIVKIGNENTITNLCSNKIGPACPCK